MQKITPHAKWHINKGVIFVFCITLNAILSFAPLNHANAQPANAEDLGGKQTISCQQAAQSFTGLIPILDKANETDTLYAIIAWWEDVCGLPEPLMRFHILHQIEINDFSEKWLPANVLSILNDYREISKWDDSSFYLDHYHNQYFAIDPGYNIYSKNLALHLQQYTDLKPIELFFIDYYSHNFDKAMSRLSSGELSGTRLDSLFRAEAEVAKKTPKPFFALYGGLWKPNGSLALLGNHPQIGFSYGVVRQRLLLEAVFKIGFLPSPNYYEVVVDNMGYRTKNFTNLHLSGRAGLVASDRNRNQVLLSIGLGYEGIEAFSSQQQEEEGLSRMISSASFSPGAEFRLPVSSNSFLGLVIRFNFLGFATRSNETPLKGNALLFGVLWGFYNK